MSKPTAFFLFLAAASVAGFVFATIVVWLHARVSEQRQRDTFALLKTVAEHPGENADRVLAYLRDEEERRRVRKEHEERKGFLVGGLCTIASGVGMFAMFPKVWGPGLLVFLVGLSLLPFGFNWKRAKRA